jgi:hypothetical protein
MKKGLFGTFSTLAITALISSASFSAFATEPGKSRTTSDVKKVETKASVPAAPIIKKEEPKKVEIKVAPTTPVIKKEEPKKVETKPSTPATPNVKREEPKKVEPSKNSGTASSTRK